MDQSEEPGVVDNSSETALDMSIPKSLPVQNCTDANNNEQNSSVTCDKEQSQNLIQGSEIDSASTVAVNETSLNSVHMLLPVSLPLIKCTDGNENDINNSNVRQSDSIDTNEMEVSDKIHVNGEDETSKEDGQGPVNTEVIEEANIHTAIDKSDADNSKCPNAEMQTITSADNMDVDQSE